MNVDNIENIKIENLETRKATDAFKKIISRLLNFICALIIFLIVLFAIGAFLSADLHSKDMLGDYDSQIFSFNKTSDNMAEIITFGEKFIIDFNKIYEARTMLISLAEMNKEYTPSVILLSGEIMENCITSVSASFQKIPSILEYFYKQTNEE